MSSDYIWLADQADLEHWIKQWREADFLALDTEFMRVRTFYIDLGIVQINDGRQVVLIDPLEIESWDSFSDLLSGDNAPLKVLHACAEDFEVLRHVLGQCPTHHFDTQIAAGLLGLPAQLGYSALVKEILDESVSKDETRSNWLQRPLTESQCEYAANDVVLLRPLYEALSERLDQKDRLDWMKEDTERQHKKLSAPEVAPSDYYTEVKNAWRMRGSQLNILRALAEWREETARQRNLPRSFIVKDSTLVDIAKRQPKNFQVLRACEDLGPQQLKRHSKTLLSLVEAGLDDSEELPELPQPLPRETQSIVKRLGQCVREEAESLGIVPEVLAKRRDLVRLLKSVLKSEPLPSVFTGWRYDYITAQLLDLLNPSEMQIVRKLWRSA